VPQIRSDSLSPLLGGERAGVIGVNITHLPVAVVLFEHLSKLSRRSAN
jgi:hypothetical protein